MKMMLLSTVALAAAGCANQSKNPLLEEFDTPFGIAPFAEITIEDYREAMLQGMAEQKAEIEAIIASTDEPTFANTIAALDQSGRLLSRARGTFSPLSSSNSTDETRALEKELSPLFSAHSDDIYLNEALFERVKKVYENQADEQLSAEEKKVLENIYDRFVNSGANLNDEEKARLRELNSRLAMLQLNFTQNLLYETNNTFVVVDNEAELAGLPEANIAAAAKMAEEQGQAGKWMFNMQRPSCNPVLQYCSNRALREKVYKAYYNRGNQDNDHDNKAISAEIVRLRLEKARLMGFENY
ncbi:MAG: peptidase M3, partial [Alistipes sp.]|nr:peptidase M3 [Alistipes sp.]